MRVSYFWWYTILMGGHDLCNDIHKFEVSLLFVGMYYSCYVMP